MAFGGSGKLGRRWRGVLDPDTHCTTKSRRAPSGFPIGGAALRDGKILPPIPGPFRHWWGHAASWAAAPPPVLTVW
jgi:hypothetical protein